MSAEEEAPPTPAESEEEEGPEPIQEEMLPPFFVPPAPQVSPEAPEALKETTSPAQETRVAGGSGGLDHFLSRASLDLQEMQEAAVTKETATPEQETAVVQETPIEEAPQEGETESLRANSNGFVGEHVGTDSTTGQVEQHEDDAPTLPDEPPPPPPSPGADGQVAPTSYIESSMPQVGAGVWDVPEYNLEKQGVEEVYARLQFQAVHPAERELLYKMTAKDPDRKGEFTINQVREFWRYLQEHMAQNTPLELTFQQDLTRRIAKDKLGLSCCVVAGIIPLFFLLWAAMALVRTTQRSFTVGDSGALVEPPLATASGEIWPVASADAVALHRLQEYSTMDLGTLHRVRDVIFMHNRVFHHFQVASFIHRNHNDLLLTAPDGATLHIFEGNARFKRGFHEEELVDLSETERHTAILGDDEWPWTSGGRFSVQAEVS